VNRSRSTGRELLPFRSILRIPETNNSADEKKKMLDGDNCCAPFCCVVSVAPFQQGKVFFSRHQNSFRVPSQE
jgi:hypothetical protein